MKRKMTNREYIKRYFPHKVSKKILGYADKDSLGSTNICDGLIERKRSEIVFGEWLMINASPWAYGDGWLVFKDRSVCTTTQTYGIFKAEQKEKKG